MKIAACAIAIALKTSCRRHHVYYFRCPFCVALLSNQAYFHFPGEAEFLMSPSPRSKTFKLFTTKMIISAIFTQIKAMGNRDLNTQVVSNKTVLYIMNALSRPAEGGIGKCGRNNPF